MKKIEEILNNYNDYKVNLDDRFGSRFYCFLEIEEMKKIGLELKDEYKKDWTKKEWTRENILQQLKRDVMFGYSKALDKREISSSLMFEVVMSWNKILEEGLENFDKNNYAEYGKPLFEETSKKYNWNLEECYDY